VLAAEGSLESLQEAAEKLHLYEEENQALHSYFQGVVKPPLLELAYH